MINNEDLTARMKLLYPRFVGAVIALFGIAMLIGGVRLAVLGGSLYYLSAGIALIASGALMVRRRVAGAWLYGLFLVATLGWSWWEVGLSYWPLIPRLVLPMLLGVLVASCLAYLQPYEPRRSRQALYGAGLLVLGLLGIAASAFVPRYLLAPRPVSDRPQNSRTEHVDTEWRYFGRTTAGTRYSPADQIDRRNIHRLRLAWTYRIPNPPGVSGAHQATPLQIGNTLYLCTYVNEVIALDAQSGRQIWRFDPRASTPSLRRCRGVGYYETKPTENAPNISCSRRIIAASVDARLFALDAATGKLCEAFGERGFVDLKVGLGEPRVEFYIPTSGPLIVRDLVIVNAFIVDNMSADMPGGVIRAFSAIDGHLVWAWDPGNDAITALPPPGQTYTRSSPNMWSVPSYDDQLGLIFAPMGVAGPDFWAGKRTGGSERYSNAVVALDIATGRPRWHFQTVHRDVWDRDLPPQPALVEVPDGKGGTIPGLIQGTKHGQIFLLDRRNGTPIASVVERPVPHAGHPDERMSPTQPFSTGMPSIGAEPLTEARMWGMTPLDQLWCRIEFKRMRYQGEFTPPVSTAETLMYPGWLGGMNWGGVAVDESRNYFIVNDIRVPIRFRLLEGAELARRNKAAAVTAENPHGGHASGSLPQEGARYGVNIEMFMSPLEIPCNTPPWGTLTAIDLTTRQVAWQIPMGTAQDSGPLGTKLRLPMTIGMPTVGGALSTRGGLVFFSGTQDYYLRALDVQTGKELWKDRLPVGSQATPMTYISPASGRQFVVVVAGGTGLMPEEPAAYVMAYSLPD